MSIILIIFCIKYERRGFFPFMLVKSLLVKTLKILSILNNTFSIYTLV